MMHLRKFSFLIRSFLFIPAVFSWCVYAEPAVAEVLKGRITDVAGKQITIHLKGQKMPQPGDGVQVFEDVPGLGLLPVKGRWQVSTVDMKNVIAKPVGETSQPSQGQSVAITSAHPQSAAQIQQGAKQIYARANDYYKGRNGKAKDYQKARELIGKAASQGYAPAQTQLGYMYGKGLGGQKNLGESFVWTRKAAMQGHTIAQYNLGLKYNHGNGVDEDKTEATKWFKKAAQQEHKDSQSMMGQAYFNGYGVEQDYRASATWYQKAAVQGDAVSQCRLGGMYAEGQGVSKDPATAQMWFQKAADQNSACGQKEMGFIYWKATDNATALEYFKRAANQGDASGQRLVGLFYERGYGVAKDKHQALTWYRKAAAQGDQEALKRIKQMGAVTAGQSTPSRKTASKVSGGAQQYIDMINASDSRICQKGAKQLHQSSYAKDPQVLAAVSQTLMDRFNTNLRNRNHIDAMAWLCNILGASGEHHYADTLKKVSRESKNRKIKKFAAKNLHRLR